MTRQLDFPFFEVKRTADDAVKRGSFILQKWTCAGCGQRITGSDVNGWCSNGACEHCFTNTDLEKAGCNFVLIQPSHPGATIADIENILGLNKGTRQ